MLVLTWWAWPIASNTSSWYLNYLVYQTWMLTSSLVFSSSKHWVLGGCKMLSTKVHSLQKLICDLDMPLMMCVLSLCRMFFRASLISEEFFTQHLMIKKLKEIRKVGKRNRVHCFYLNLTYLSSPKQNKCRKS